MSFNIYFRKIYEMDFFLPKNDYSETNKNIKKESI